VSEPPVPSHDEIERQYRTIRLLLDAHGFLKDRHDRLARLFEISLLGCSVVFCATTFAQDGLYQWMGIPAEGGRYLLGVASIIAFGISVSLLAVDVRGRAALHGAAMDRWARAQIEFRRVQPDTGSEWPLPSRAHLHEVYWSADRESVKIPNSWFLALKSRHLRKVEVSKLKSRYPSCPRFVISLSLRARDTRGYLAEVWRGGRGTATRRKPGGD
jgi:hypothetical protein